MRAYIEELKLQYNWIQYMQTLQHTVQEQDLVKDHSTVHSVRHTVLKQTYLMVWDRLQRPLHYTIHHAICNVSYALCSAYSVCQGV